MNIWSILLTGLVVAFFGWRRERVRRLFDPSLRKERPRGNKEELKNSLDILISFLWKHEVSRWPAILREVRNDLEDPAKERSALERLSTMFGGMGSLNDLTFDSVELDDETGHLLNAVFRDMKLYYGTETDRAHWKILEDQHKGELPPRIKHAFRKD